ncbi:MAG: hypothetical protein PHH68_02805 [Candidatus Omnitrophica bacterium]|jgi:hypothetical protein|nr:hypothetical protein [Candidatus Omnitrophota bacterium]
MMEQKTDVKKTNKLKVFFSGIFAKIDKKIEEKAKKTSCGCCNDKKEDKSCCN